VSLRGSKPLRQQTRRRSRRPLWHLQQPEPSKPPGGHRPGPGRLGAAAYGGARRGGAALPGVRAGHPVSAPCRGERRMDGQARRSARRDEREKRRCLAGGEICPAGLPAGGGDEQDSARARAVLAVSRYALGVPGDRLQGAQAMRGVPVPEATPWDQSEVGGDCATRCLRKWSVRPHRAP
jgi:hypothetical protein